MKHEFERRLADMERRIARLELALERRLASVQERSETRCIALDRRIDALVQPHIKLVNH